MANSPIATSFSGKRFFKSGILHFLAKKKKKKKKKKKDTRTRKAYRLLPSHKQASQPLTCRYTGSSRPVLWTEHPKIAQTQVCSSPRKSLVKGERFVRAEEKPEQNVTSPLAGCLRAPFQPLLLNRGWLSVQPRSHNDGKVAHVSLSHTHTTRDKPFFAQILKGCTVPESTAIPGRCSERMEQAPSPTPRSKNPFNM